MDCEPYLRQLAANNWSPETIKAYRSDLNFFAEFLKQQGLRITQVSPATIASYVEHMKAQPNPRFGRIGLRDSSISRRITAVSGLFDFLRSTSNPRLKNPAQIAMKRKHRTVRNDSAKAMDELSLDTLINGITNLRDRALVMLFVTSGLRLSELHQLDIATIHEVTEDRPDGTSQTWGTGRVIGKGSKERIFYFDEPTVAAVHEYLDTRTDTDPALFLSERRVRLSRRAIQDVVEDWCRKLNLTRVHVHQLRHTFATRLANANIPAMVLKDLMGHSSFDTTARYFKLSDETRARQYFAAMEFIHPPQS